MRFFLNAGFGWPLTPADLSMVKGLGFDGIRQDVLTPSRAEELVHNIHDAGMAGIFIAPTLDVVAALAKVVPIGSAIEFINEPDLQMPNDAKLYAMGLSAANSLVPPGVVLLSGGISGLGTKQLAWLSKVLPYVPADVQVGFHTYPAATASNLSALKKVSNGRAIWNTEIGWSTAKRSLGFPLCWLSTQLTDPQVGANIEEEIRLNGEAGARAFTLYQLNDGAGAGAGDHFGIRRADGILKPQALVVSREKGKWS